MNNKLEESVIDYFLVCQDFYFFVNSMTIDTDRNYVLTKFTRKNERCYTIESDHNPLIMEINIPWNSKIRENRIEIFKLRNKNCQKDFFQNTNNSDILSKCLMDRNIRE